MRFVLDRQRPSGAGRQSPVRLRALRQRQRASLCCPAPGATGPTRANGSGRPCCCRRSAPAAGATGPSWTTRSPRTSGSSESTSSTPTAPSHDDSLHKTAAALQLPVVRAVPARPGRRRAGATRILDRYYELGGDHFLAFDLGPLLQRPRGLRCPSGRGDARHLIARYGDARHDDDLPRTRSTTSSRWSRRCSSCWWRRTGRRPTRSTRAELSRRLPWLTAFAADQPDVRLRHVPIRHWDGYWFGAAAVVGRRLPALLVGPECSRVRRLAARTRRPSEAPGWTRPADAILRANLANFAATARRRAPSSIRVV